MTFKQQQDIIIQYILDNYSNYLPDNLKQFEITCAFLDLDRFKKSFTVFLDFNKVSFPDTRYEDDCKNVEQLLLTIYLVHRNAQSEVLKENCLDSSWAFYKMIGELKIKTINEFNIDSLEFFDYAEGNKFLVVSEISCVINLDIER
jgi:hypothetical protein